MRSRATREHCGPLFTFILLIPEEFLYASLKQNMIKKPTLHSHFYFKCGFDKLLVFIYSLIYGLKCSQWVEKVQRHLMAHAEVSQIHKYISVCQAGASAPSKVINTYAKTSASFFCSTRSKGFAEPVGDVQIAIVHFPISAFIGGSEIQTESMSTRGSLTSRKCKQPLIVSYTSQQNGSEERKSQANVFQEKLCNSKCYKRNINT